MAQLFEKSLLLRLAVMMTTITALAVIGMVSSVILAEMMKGEAAAINQAGSLRMQSYRIGTRLLAMQQEADRYEENLSREIVEFEERLASPRLVNILPSNPKSVLRAAYDQVVAEWGTSMRPLLIAALESTPPSGEMGAETLQHLDNFVAQLDHMVKLLEDDAESKIFLLRLIQGISLFLTLVVVYLTMYFMHTDVLVPLRDLLTCAEHARRGEFSTRVQHTGEDELGRLGNAFNVMAEDLSKMYGDLESRVAEKTADLERSNRSLELLYNTIARLTETEVSDATFTALLQDIERVIGIRSGLICLSNPGGGRIFTYPPDEHAVNRAEHDADFVCDTCTGDVENCLRLCWKNKDGMRTLTVPLKDQEHTYGMLLFQIPEDSELAPWQTQLLEAVGRHVGIAIGTSHRAIQNRRLALLEERAVIARELHDSLAQSLSYLKIQVSRLQSLLDHDADTAEVNGVVNELREGLNGAYRQLRELLTTFRLKMDGRGLARALEETVEEFRARSGITLTLDNRLLGCQLTVNEEIHILQIVREALANVTHHAHAEHAWVTLRRDAEGRVTVLIEDDGVGIELPEDLPYHHGLVIMQERAHGLHGKLCVRPRPEGGTCVELNFLPTMQNGLACDTPVEREQT